MDRIDLATLDRDVRAAAQGLEQFRARLATEDGRASGGDPFAGLRHVATRQTHRALLELEPSLHEIPLRDGLVRWVYELLQARIGLDLELADAEAMHREDDRVPKRARDDAPAKTYAEAWSRVLATDPSRGALERAADLAPSVAAVRKERRARRFEAARRLDLPRPDALAMTTELDASALLDRTEALAKDLVREARRTHEGSWTAASAMHLALAEDAREGWPAKLTARWLREAFRALASRDVLGKRELPVPLGGATFLRGAATWGFALRSAGVPRSLPFALASDPYPTSAHRFAAAAASAVAEPSFQRRVLGASARVASAQSRALRRSLLFATRLAAARHLIAAREDVDATLFEELTVRLFGVPMPAALAGAWPPPRIDDSARFAAVLGAHAFVRALVDRFDEDWFANPRAGAHLAQMAAAPAFDADPPEKQAPIALARAFEEALG
ncbi:MAG TPA: hypothetical protein VIF62_39175 [Labilithrix sp.]|jgi:hypothetical protein